MTGETLEVARLVCYNDTYNKCMEAAVSPGQEFIEWASGRTLSIGRSYAKETRNTLRLSQSNWYAVLVWLCRKKVVEIEERL